MKSIEILGIPMDLGAQHRGVDMGPSALRIAGLIPRLQALGCKVHDRGDLFIPNMESQHCGDPRLKFKDPILEISKTLAETVDSILEAGHFPLCLGGDHSIAIGTLAGISQYCRRHNKTLGVLWVDAHADFNTYETSPSGNIHGMPLAISAGLGDEQLTGLLGFKPKLGSGRIALLGIRSVDEKERSLLRSCQVKTFTITDIDKSGMFAAVSRALDSLSAVDHLHVSFDLDVVDPQVIPGVGTPIPGGLTYRETHLLMEAIAERHVLASLELTELNPIRDNRNQSAELAVEFLASCLGQTII